MLIGVKNCKIIIIIITIVIYGWLEVNLGHRRSLSKL